MIASLICAGIKVIIEGRGDSLRQVAQSLVTVVVISGAGLVLASALISIFDDTAVWLLDSVTEESAETFGKRIIPVLWESTQVPGGTVPVLLLALAGILANVIQMAMIWIRSILLMVIMGLAPIIASTISTSWGRAWAGKILGFFSGLVLYKLAVSVIYATTILFLTSESGLEGFVSFSCWCHAHGFRGRVSVCARGAAHAHGSDDCFLNGWGRRRGYRGSDGRLGRGRRCA